MQTRQALLLFSKSTTGVVTIQNLVTRKFKLSLALGIIANIFEGFFLMMYFGDGLITITTASLFKGEYLEEWRNLEFYFFKNDSQVYPI